MIATQEQRAARNREKGSALLIALFLMTTLMMFATVATLRTITEGRREKEEELAWRGNQYVRAVRLFYKKNGRFPQSIDDLTKYHTDQPRFIRQAYKDPMNTDDGSWRLIYVLPNGQLVGSVMHKALQGSLMAGPANPLGNPPAAGSPGQTGSTGQSTSGQTQTPPSGQASSAGQSSQPGQDQSGSGGQVFGGSLVGFASKVKKPSIRTCEGGKTYYEWEFIWDPTAANSGPCEGISGFASTSTGAPPGTTPPSGTTPPAGTTPNPQTPQQQNPQQQNPINNQ
jgi:hypothetical protein